MGVRRRKDYLLVLFMLFLMVFHFFCVLLHFKIKHSKMKKVLFLAVLMGFLTNVNAQLVVRYQNNVLASGDTVSVRAEGDEAKFAPAIENTSSEACDVLIKATRCNVTDTRVVSICAGVCVSDTISHIFTINAGETYSTAYVDFYVPQNSEPALFKIDIRPSVIAAPIFVCYVWVYNANAGINDMESSSLLSAWPNPAQNRVTVDYSCTENAALVLYDMKGAQVASIPVSATESSVTFDVSALPSGVYLYGIRTAGTVSPMRKLVIK